MKLQHEHPFTLIDNGGQLLCPYCGEYLNEWYYCKCYSYICTLCGEYLSGSCYTCKLCWPDSYIAHQSCFELPEEIQITYRPHCLLHLEEQSSESKELDCDFCEQKYSHLKYRCGDCDFQIGVDCASKLIKYHEGQQHVEHFSHRHPLTLLKLDHMTCKLCSKNIDVPGYGCAPCKFYIHNSCRGFLKKVRHPFHPRHCLTLVVDTKTKSLCEACCFDIQGSSYQCIQSFSCDHELHPECIHLKPNIRYTGHEHFLILVENLSFQSTCETCRFRIEGVFFMRCVECRLNFHVNCGFPALPPIVWHKEHNHPLIHITETLAKDDSHLLDCNLCGKERDSEAPFYRCEECEFFSHVRCAIIEVESDEAAKLRHFSHEHILLLREIYKNDDISCYGCGKVIQGMAYGCDPCQLYVHKSCAEVPIWIRDHQLDEHDLTLEAFSDFECEVCKKCSDGFRYSCHPCNFHMDLDCASLHPSVNLVVHTNEYKYQEDQERIGHFSHRHHLVILEVAEVCCKLCHKYINGQCYGCAQCEFYIHKSCGSLPQEILHPFHPRHSLKLSVDGPRFRCDACDFDIQNLRYKCEECNFDLHPECSSLNPNIDYKGHQHLLILVENTANEGECEACHHSVQGAFFMRCKKCKLNFHVQCGPLPLPQTILQKQHRHPLTLSNEKLAKDNSDQLCCAVCHKERNREHPSYYCTCDDCEYYAHVRCVISEVPVDEREMIKHFSHKHSLFFFENDRIDDIICSACEKNIQANSVYGCDPCKFYIHKTCVELPIERQHPFHRHSLSIKFRYFGNDCRCNACHKYFRGFSMQCSLDCGFNLDLECCLFLPSLKLPSVHDHTLTFFKKLYGIPKCEGCNLTPPNKFSALDAFYVRCVQCDFSLHLLCCPLPQTLRHDSHPHPLILRDNFIDLFDGFEDEEYCCDVCETRRDARGCVYYCEECSFVVDIECLFSEVMQFLEGKRKDVESRIASRKRKIGLTYKVMVKSLTEDEKKMIKFVTSEAEQKIKEGTALDLFDELKDINVRFSKELSSVDHKQLQSLVMEGIEGILQVDYINEVDPEFELVIVGEYKIVQKLAPVLKKLLEKYKDFCSTNSLTQSLKMIFLNMLCWVIDNMEHTNVEFIKRPSIMSWWFDLKLVERAGFKVDFVLDHVKSIAAVAYYLQDNEESMRRSHLTDLHREIYHLSHNVDEQKERIEELKQEAHVRVSSHDSERWILQTKRFNEVVPFKWKNAAAGLLDNAVIPKL